MVINFVVESPSKLTPLQQVVLDDLRARFKDVQVVTVAEKLDFLAQCVVYAGGDAGVIGALSALHGDSLVVFLDDSSTISSHTLIIASKFGASINSFTGASYDVGMMSISGLEDRPGMTFAKKMARKFILSDPTSKCVAIINKLLKEKASATKVVEYLKEEGVLADEGNV